MDLIILRPLRKEKVSFLAKNLGAPFVVSFMALIGVNSVFVIAGQTSLSNLVTISAYILLGVGIFLQIISAILVGKYSEHREKASVRDNPV